MAFFSLLAANDLHAATTLSGPLTPGFCLVKHATPHLSLLRVMPVHWRQEKPSHPCSHSGLPFRVGSPILGLRRCTHALCQIRIRGLCILKLAILERNLPKITNSK
jgi:hypothetical protein